ncbi:MAG: hypothetical protein ACAI18_17155 [Gemmatimonadales bacterium]
MKLALLCAIQLSLPLRIWALPVQSRAARPGPRNAHGTVYDLRDSALVLYGGATADAVRGDTWRWKAGTWRLVSLDGPGPRTFPALAYDSARGEVVLFGGNRVLFGDSMRPTAMLGDTWVLRGDTWLRMAEAGPPQRAEAAIAHDPGRRRTVLFGGRYEVDGKTVRLGDTWEWDGSQWTRMSSSGPSPRSGAAMAYHPGLQAVVLFGGSGGPLGDTWSWNGREWTLLPVPTAPGRFNTVMAWDPSTKRLARFGGWDGKERTSDTWELEEEGWVRFQGDRPSSRNHATMVTAADRGSMLLYGGHDGDRVFGDLWERGHGRWRLREFTEPVARVANGH